MADASLGHNQKEAKEFLEREWNAQYWSRNTSMTLEEYIDDDENWERASQHAWEVMDEARGISKKEDDDDDDDDDDSEEDEGEAVGEGKPEDKEDKDNQENSSETDAASGPADIAGKDNDSSKTKKTTKADADVTKVHFM